MTSTAHVYSKQTTAGRSEIVFNYGAGRHSSGQVFQKPYYYKLEGPLFPRKTRILDEKTFPKDEFEEAMRIGTFKLVDGPTGVIWKQ